jgi:glycosyltransferase involved in cell wall biosynthesis
MTSMERRVTRTPTITAVVAAYNAEHWIAETLEAVLGQTRSPDEVIVVDDGSTDGTAAVLQRFAERVRIVTRENGGCPAAFNTAFAHATGDYVAMCGADDVWEPRKLEWNARTLADHPEVDVVFGDAQLFGLADGTYAKPPGEGVLDGEALRDALYRENIICAPSIVIRRSLFERLGPFVEKFGADDLEYWMRCLREGATFYYDRRVLLRYRRHDGNLSSRLLWMAQCSHDVHRWYADDVKDRVLVRDVLADDHFKIARHMVDEGRAAEARAAFRASLRHRRRPRALVWTLVLTLPDGARRRAGDSFVRLSRALETRRTAPEPTPS